MSRSFHHRLRAARAAGLTRLLVPAAIAAASCGGEPAASAEGPGGHDWPSGTVLVLNAHPIPGDEVDALGADFALLEPQDSPLQLRRLALSRVLFPLIAAQGIDRERRRSAEALASEYRAASIRGDRPSGPTSGPTSTRRTGDFSGLGFTLWRVALRTRPGSWSDVVESPGCFHLFRVESREEGALPSLTRFTIDALDFPYLDAGTAGADIEAALDRSKLIILDETWRDAVPAAWRYRLDAENP